MNNKISSGNALNLAACLQGIYYFLTGAWPLIHMASFTWVTGPKTDYWLVRMVSLLIVSISLALISVAYRKKVTLEIQILAISAILSFCLIDFYYSWIDTISGIYVLDAVAELLLLFFWMLGIWKAREVEEES